MNTPVVRTVLAVAGLTAGLLGGCVESPTTSPPRPDATSAPAVRTPVTDPETGVRADLPGPVREDREQVIDPDQEVFGPVYGAVDPSGGVEVVLRLNPLPRDQRISPETTAERTAHYQLGEVTASEPRDVGGHPALDARIEGWTREGGSGSGLLLMRIVEAPRFGVVVEAYGDAAEAALVQEVFDQVCTSLRIP